MSETFFSLVTGASRGIGECFARALAARRHNLILVARSAGALQGLGSELSQRHGIQTEVVELDLSRISASTLLVRQLSERGLAVDLLVNNAGFAGRGEFWRLPLDPQMEMVRLHVHTLVELTHHLLAPMVERRRGGLINVSSLTGFQSIPYAAVYAASKAFVTSFSMGLAEEVRGYGISVVTLCPGGTRTSLRVIGQAGGGTFPGRPPAPDEVVEEALKALDRGGGLVVPRWINKLTVFAHRVLPRGGTARLLARLSRPEQD
ncbi:MAG: SDR family NAD(P)-dependent oxidoreductase [Acidobacteriota bacterium]